MRFHAFVPALLVVIGSAAPAVAGGYFYGPNGARASGRGGAFVAKADDLSAVMLNPAGLVHEHGTLLQLGNRFSYNALSYRRAPTLDWGAPNEPVPPYTGFPTVENEKPWQALDPIVGAASDFGLKDFRFALAAVAVTGASQESFPITGGQRYMMVSREALIVNYVATAAYRFRDLFGVGVSLVDVAVPKLKYDLVIQGSTAPGSAFPITGDPDIHATTDGSDLFTPNLVLGSWYRPVPAVELGLSGQVLPTNVVTDSKLTVEPLGGTDLAVSLERQGQSANDVNITFPLPLVARAGARYRELRGARELFDVELDLTYETWSRVKRFLVDTHGLVAHVATDNIDLGQIDIEKHWRDTLGLALGGDYSVVKDLVTVRGGLFYESAVSNPHYANVDFVSGAQLGGALGTSLYWHGAEVALAYEYRHQPTMSVSEGDARVYQQAPGSSCTAPYTDPNTCNAHYLGVPAPPVNAGTYKAHAHVASLDLLYRF